MIERPWRTGKFIITAGLKPLENKPIFLPEENPEKYLQNKHQARLESLSKLYPEVIGMSVSEIQKTAEVLRTHIAKDLPLLRFSEIRNPRDEIDYLISQVPEDFSVWKMDDEKEWLALIHLSSPNHWDARNKIGKSFFASHESIPHIDVISKAAPKMFEQIQKRGAVERYAWGVATDDRLNHHPEAPPGISDEEWKGRSFNNLDPKLFIRMERQTLFPIDEKLIGFTIKTSFVDVASLPVEDHKLIYQAISGMDQAILHYKGLITDRDPILTWLNSRIHFHQTNSFAAPVLHL